VPRGCAADRPARSSGRIAAWPGWATASPSDVENLWAGSDTSVNGRFEERCNDRKDIEMRKLIATEWMSLDGVVQAPSSPDEDRSGGFDRGGWRPGYFDDPSMNWVAEMVGGAGGYLLGRGTYMRLRRPLAGRVGGGAGARRAAEYASEVCRVTTLVEPLEWPHSTLLRGDVGDAVRALKAQDGDDLLVIGSPGLVGSLVELDLLDELRVMIDPLVVGAGKRLFGDGIPVRALRLVESQVTGTGAIIAAYSRGGADARVATSSTTARCSVLPGPSRVSDPGRTRYCEMCSVQSLDVDWVVGAT
jgi:dihydrofolate reductase